MTTWAASLIYGCSCRIMIKVLVSGASVFVVLIAFFFDQQAGDFFRFDYV